jgi:Flp pilus assembly protein TadG
MSRFLAPIAVAKALRRFRRNRHGSAAVEFALVAPMFFALLFAIIETGLMFFASQVLETATVNSARIIQTGQAQTPGSLSASQTTALTEAQFQQYICTQVPVLLNCNNISIDVEASSASWPQTVSSQIDNSGNFVTDNLQYNLGGPCDLVVVRLFYQWPLFVTGLGYNISNISGNKRLLYGAAAFRNEPYGTCSS